MRISQALRSVFFSLSLFDGFHGRAITHMDPQNNHDSTPNLEVSYIMMCQVSEILLPEVQHQCSMIYSTWVSEPVCLGASFHTAWPFCP
ncbi:hypothetical protein EDD18DRAFT_1168381 [Armillaria luteobubalina]|uniref:Uncharacterized protein n=1 Tax=Armillaria luteobubalina TaxID=153913 RepID=A0AA39Q4B3_9AGAR|nr:hypothetical protein EDD18DRAFT_1168381 [Armillaria luteobubalina]